MRRSRPSGMRWCGHPWAIGQGMARSRHGRRVVPGRGRSRTIARRLRMDGAGAVTDELSVGFRRSVARGTASTVRLDVVRDAVLVDVSNTVSTGSRPGSNESYGKSRAVGAPPTRADARPTSTRATDFLRRLAPSEETALLDG